MSLPLISVLVPTIDGREEHFERCRAAYEGNAAGEYELDLVVARNEPTCGWGWQSAAERMHPSSGYVHFTCDDIEPLAGWAAPAMGALDRRWLPAPRILNAQTGAPEMFPGWGVEWPDGTLAGMSCLPFITRELWDKHVSPMLCSHYFTDNWITVRAEPAGYTARVVRAYAFRHHWAEHKRGAGMGYLERLRHDQGVVEEAVRMVQAGKWREPWPPREVTTPGTDQDGGGPVPRLDGDNIIKSWRYRGP